MKNTYVLIEPTDLHVKETAPGIFTGSIGFTDHVLTTVSYQGAVNGVRFEFEKRLDRLFLETFGHTGK